MSPSQLSPLHVLLKIHLRRGDATACADAFWKHWAGVRGYHPPPGNSGKADGVGEQREQGSLELKGASPEGFGDEWAWNVWHGGDDGAAAGAVEFAATCFVKLGRFVGQPLCASLSVVVEGVIG